MEDLGTFGGDESYAEDVSADGRVVVGRAKTTGGDWRAFHWTEDGGMEDLGTLGGDGSWAPSVSADGRVVVGVAKTTGGGWHAFRWTEDGGMEDLGTLGGYHSFAYGVSADGRVVVGATETTGGDVHAFRWTEERGMEDLNVVYESLLDDSRLSQAFEISPYGRFIVGSGYNSETDRGEAFLLATGVAPEKFELTIHSQPREGGTITLDPPGGTYDGGTEVTVTAEPAEGYEFDRWSGDYPGGREFDSQITLTIDSDKLLTANFTSKKVPKPSKHFPWALVSVVVIVAAGIVGVWYFKRYR